MVWTLDKNSSIFIETYLIHQLKDNLFYLFFSVSKFSLAIGSPLNTLDLLYALVKFGFASSNSPLATIPSATTIFNLGYIWLLNIILTASLQLYCFCTMQLHLKRQCSWLMSLVVGCHRVSSARLATGAGAASPTRPSLLIHHLVH